MPRMSADERYNYHGPAYHRLRLCQNLEATLLPVLKKKIDLAGKEVVEMGAGTGPITLCLLPHVAFASAYDLRVHMVETARENLSASGYANWTVAVGDHRALPHPDHSADLVVAGFTFGPMVAVERERDWKGRMDKNWIEPECDGMWWKAAPL
jgi:predicted RNA methylase